MPVTLDEFRSGMRGLAAAVTVVTTAAGPERGGLTATAVMSLTGEPPQIGVAVNKTNRSLALLERAGIFAINVLAQDQVDVGNVFAGRTSVSGAGKFAAGSWTTLLTGAPILEHARVNFDCRLAGRLDLSTHVLLVGLIEAVHVNPHRDPLLYADGCYGGFSRRERRDYALASYTSTFVDHPW